LSAAKRKIRVTGGRRRIDRSSCVNGDEITVDGGYASMLMNLVPQPGFEWWRIGASYVIDPGSQT
jgi:hypothetical protein